MDVANGIDTHNQDRDKYIKAANEFRMPYWDWARKDALIFPQEALDDQLPFSTNLKFPSSTASVSPTSNPLFKAPFNKDSIFDDTFVSLNTNAVSASSTSLLSFTFAFFEPN